MPPKGRIKHANQHDRRNDTGLAAPGKRIPKDKASSAVGSISTNGRAANNNSPGPAGAAGGTPPSELSTPEYHSNGVTSPQGANGQSKHAEEEDLLAAYQSNVGDGDLCNTGGHSISNDAPCSGDSSSLRAVTAHAVSSLSLAATILSACPLRDAIAILILFLSLPPTLIITIHSLFASLTFVPPAAAFSWTSGTHLPAFADWFQATPGGGPSPFTILVSDVVMTLLYLLCPLHLQNIFMDLGQAVVAISLSGAAAGTGSSTRSVAVCSTMILCSHVFRYKHASIAQMFAALTHTGSTSVAVRDFSETPLHSPAKPVVHSWPRLLLGCHLVAQGLLTLIRRWFAGAAQKKQASKLEAEQATLFRTGKLAMFQLDNSEAGSNVSTDGRPPGPPATAREAKEKMSNSKRKRKQANQARSQQPLWAAIASTKVTFMKELEHKQHSQDAAEVVGSHARGETSLAGAGVGNRMWILDIGPTQVNFRADISVSTAVETLSLHHSNSTVASGASKQQSFYIRLNGADWTSTRIAAYNTSPNADGRIERYWIAEVLGLSPLTRYTCELVRPMDQKVICTSQVVTSPALEAEQAPNTVSAPPAQPLRPMSPTSTLKKSIAAAEAQREEVRNRLKRNKKEHQKAAAAIRRDVELLQNKISSFNVHDEKSRSRILQLRQQIKQSEDAAQALREECETLGEVPKDVVDKAATARKLFDEARSAKEAAFAAADEARMADTRESSALTDQLATLSQKRERLLGRKAKLEEAIERQRSEQTATQSAKQQHEQARAFRREEQSKQLNQIVYWIQATRAEADSYNAKANELFSSLQGSEGVMHLSHMQQQQLPPPTPEGNLPGTNGPLGVVAQPFEFVPFGSGAAMSMGQQPQAHMLPPWNSSGFRQRSSSMLSGYSGFTDEHVEAGNGHGKHGVVANGGMLNDAGYVRHGSDSDGSTGSGLGVSAQQQYSNKPMTSTSWAQAPAFTSTKPVSS